MVRYIGLVLRCGALADVFDETSQPVRTGALRFTFDPPLWNAKAKAAFKQELDIPTSSVTITTPDLIVAVHFELNAPLRDGVPHRDAALLHVTAKPAGGNSNSSSTTGGGTFGLKVAVEPYRKEGQASPLGAGLCSPGIIPMHHSFPR